MLPLTVLIFIRNLIFRNKTLVINGQIWYYKFQLNWNSNQPMRRRVGMADEADSKSVVGNHVRVQVPLPAVLKHQIPVNHGVWCFSYTPFFYVYQLENMLYHIFFIFSPMYHSAKYLLLSAWINPRKQFHLHIFSVHSV